MTCFDKKNAQDYSKTLGMFLISDKKEYDEDGLTFDHFIKYVKSLVNTTLDTQNIELMLDRITLKRTCQIDSLGISSTDTMLSLINRKMLYFFRES